MLLNSALIILQSECIFYELKLKTSCIPTEIYSQMVCFLVPKLLAF